MTKQYRALWVEVTANEQFDQHVVDRELDELEEQLPDNELLVEVHYSSLNYKDALSANGNRGVTRHYPHQPGIDAAGRVVEDSSGRFRAGDSVIVSGYDLGMNTPGGLGQYIRVPAAWAIALPQGLSLEESMVIGTAGFTAALSVDKLLHMGARPEDGTVIVTGATGGVGSFSVSLLSHLGFEVAAVTGKLEQSDWLVKLGAQQVVERRAVAESTSRPVDRPEWAHGVDCVGGDILTNLVKGLRYGGSVAICGMAGAPEFHATVFPFILRGVNVLGIDSVELPLEKKTAVWQRLAEEWHLPHLKGMAETISLDQVPEYLTRILNGHAVGRYLVDLRR